jgi:hypothetical protein
MLKACMANHLPVRSRLTLLAGITLVSGLLSYGCSGGGAADESDTKPKVPLGLDLVPTDAPGFVSIRVADLFQSKSAQELRDYLAKAAPDYQKDLKKNTGLDISQIERLTVILPSQPREAPVILVTGVKSLPKAAILDAFFPKRAEKKFKDFTIYMGTGKPDRVLHFVDARVLAIAPMKQMEVFLSRSPAKKGDGSADAIRALTARDELLLAAVSLKHELIQSGLKAMVGTTDMGPLLAMKAGVLTIVGDKDLTARARLTFANADGADKGEAALKAALKQAQVMLEQSRDHMLNLGKRAGADDMGKWIARSGALLCEKVLDGVKHGKIQKDQETLQVTFHVKTSVIDVANSLAVTAAFLFRSPPPDRPKPRIERPKEQE